MPHCSHTITAVMLSRPSLEPATSSKQSQLSPSMHSPSQATSLPQSSTTTIASDLPVIEKTCRNLDMPQVNHQAHGSTAPAQSATKQSSLLTLDTRPSTFLPLAHHASTPTTADSSSPATPSLDLHGTFSIGSFPQPPSAKLAGISFSRPTRSLPVSTCQTPTILSALNSPIRAINPGSSSTALPPRSHGGQSQPLKNPTRRASDMPSSHRNPNGHTRFASLDHSRRFVPSSPLSNTHTSVSLSQSPTEDRDHNHAAISSNVLVSVRIRPDSDGDMSKSPLSPPAQRRDWTVNAKEARITHKGGLGGDYVYDNVLAPRHQNDRVYDDTTRALVRRVMQGFHGTVFAYGMTGTGKTFSMQGISDSPGIIPLAIADIFSYIRDTPSREFLIRASYLEIYNEKIYDLLAVDPNTDQEEIHLRQDKRRGVYATPLKEEIVQSPTQLLRVIARGDIARRTAATLYNARSSRSHAVVQIVIESRKRTHSSASETNDSSPAGILISTLSLIDLAGSEKAADVKDRRTEGSHINKSLLTLGTIIARLSGDNNESSGASKDKDVVKHLPYRDSKLTRLLQPALSGDSLVSILCTVRLGHVGGVSNLSETLNTLKFASRAKNNIVSHAKRNETIVAHAGDHALLERYRAEIDDLRRQLRLQQQVNAAAQKTEDDFERSRERQHDDSLERHEEQLMEIQLARTALKERISHLNRLILSSRSTSISTPPCSEGEDGSQAAERVGVALGSPGFTRHDSSDGTINQRTRDDHDRSILQRLRTVEAEMASKTTYITSLETKLGLAKKDGGLGINVKSDSENHERQQMLLDEKNQQIALLRTELEEQRRANHALLYEAATRRSTGSGSASIDAASWSTQEYAWGRRPSMGDLRSQPNFSRPAAVSWHKKQASVDDITRMLDEMIQAQGLDDLTNRTSLLLSMSRHEPQPMTA